MNLFFLDYAALLVAFLVTAYKLFKGQDDHNRNDDSTAVKMPERTNFQDNERIENIRI